MEPHRMKQDEPNNLQEFTEETPNLPPRKHCFEQHCQTMASDCAESVIPAIWNTSVLADVIDLEVLGNAVQTNRNYRKSHSCSSGVPRREDGQMNESGHEGCSNKGFDDFENQDTDNQINEDWYMKLNKDTMEQQPVWKLQCCTGLECSGYSYRGKH